MNTLDVIRKELDSRIITTEFTDLKELLGWFEESDFPKMEQYIRFEDSKYCRISLIENKYYDLLLCCWKPEQRSPFHGHPDQGCLVKMLFGELNEDLKYSNGDVVTNHYVPGDTCYINDGIGYHSVYNTSGENAVSLHLYAPGGYTPQYF